MERVCSTGLERHPPQMEGEVSCKFISYHQLTNKRVWSVSFHNALRILNKFIEYLFRSYSSSTTAVFSYMSLCNIKGEK